MANSFFDIETKEEAVGAGRWVEDLEDRSRSFRMTAEFEKVLHEFSASRAGEYVSIFIPTVRSFDEDLSVETIVPGARVQRRRAVTAAVVVKLSETGALMVDRRFTLDFFRHSRLPLTLSPRGVALCQALQPRLGLSHFTFKSEPQQKQIHLRSVDAPRGERKLRRVWTNRPYPRHHFEMTTSTARVLTFIAHEPHARVWVPTVLRNSRMKNAFLGLHPCAEDLRPVHRGAMENLFENELLELSAVEEGLLPPDIPICHWMPLRPSPLGHSIGELLKREADGLQPISTIIHHDKPIGRRRGNKSTDWTVANDR
jgi:hypothetical protein